jgi:DNA-binding SARP family transcriptional activator
MLTFRILGPLEVANDNGLVDLGGEQQRSLLALLLLRVNEVVPTGSLVDALWDGQPPRTAMTSLQNRISRLRKLLGADTLETRPPGYRLRVAPEQLDVVQFELLVKLAEGQAPEERASTLAQALALWRGEPLADLTFKAFAQDEIRRLAHRRLIAHGHRIRADLDCGRHEDVVAELKSLVEADPLNEELGSQLMVALYRCGQQADAMRAFHAVRNALDDELGQPPGAALQDAYRAILQHRVPPVRPARRRRTLDERYDEIVQAALHSQLVPVLGPDVRGSQAALDAVAAATHLSQRFACPPEYGGSLARVGQWVAVTQGVGPLYDELHALYGQNVSPGPVHRSLAALTALLRARGLGFGLLLTSGFDRMLEQAYSDAGEEYDVLSFVSFGRDRGKFLHIPAGGPARMIDEPNREVGLTSEARTLIVRLNGGTDELSGRVRDSYVVSEDDYIDYLSHADVTTLLPVGLAARLRRSHLLFVGYEVDDWSPRVFLRRLWAEEPISYKSWAVVETPSRVTAEQWRQLGVDTLAVTSDEALEELHRRVAAELADRAVP